MNIAFYVSGSASRLRLLIRKDSDVLGSTRLVVNDGGTNYPLEHALRRYPDIVYIEAAYEETASQSGTPNAYISGVLLESFIANHIDYCFCFGDRLLEGGLLETYRHRIINFHPSILPAFPGRQSIDQAVASHSFLLGNSAHFIDEGIDTGPVIMQSVIHGSEYGSYADVLDLQIPMIEQIFAWLQEDRIRVDGETVDVAGACYGRAVFFPKLDNSVT